MARREGFHGGTGNTDGLMWILRQADKFQCLLWIHNWDAAEVTDYQKILIASDDQISGNSGCA